MAFNNKNKSRLPQPSKKTSEDNSGGISKLELDFERPPSTSSNGSQDSGRQTLSGSGRRNISDRSTGSGRDNKNQQNIAFGKSIKKAPNPPPKSNNGPLAKAMQKKPQLSQRSYETFADEKVESVSQKLRGKSKADQQKRREALEQQVQEAEAQIYVLTDLLDKREKYLQETKENAERESTTLQDKVANQEEKLITNGIDPVTGEKVPVTDGEQKKAESNRKFNKKYIQEMKEKLRLMNSKTETYLSDIENTVNYLDSLEDASTRAGPISEAVQTIVNDVGPDDFIAKVYAENTPPQKSNDNEDLSDEEGKLAREENAEDGESKYDGESKEDEPSGKDSGGDPSSKLFLTRQVSDVEMEGAPRVEVSVAPKATNVEET